MAGFEAHEVADALGKTAEVVATRSRATVKRATEETIRLAKMQHPVEDLRGPELSPDATHAYVVRYRGIGPINRERYEYLTFFGSNPDPQWSEDIGDAHAFAGIPDLSRETYSVEQFDIARIDVERTPGAWTDYLYARAYPDSVAKAKA